MDGVNPPAPPRSRAALHGALVYSALLLGVVLANAFFLWSGDLPTVVAIPFAMFGIVVLAHTISVAFRSRDAVPLAIVVATLVIATQVPFIRFAHDWDFARYRAAREAIAPKLLRDHPFGDVDAPIGGGPVLSHGLRDNTAAVTDCGRVRCVLFFVYARSKFQPAEGFLYVPDGGDPAAFHWYGAFSTSQLAQHWYYAVEQ